LLDGKDAIFFSNNCSPRIISYSLSGDPGTIATVTGYVSFDGSEDPVSGLAALAAPLPFMTWAEGPGYPCLRQQPRS